MGDTRELLIEQVVSAWRPTSADGTMQPLPAWHDLDAAGRREAYEQTAVQRQLEAGLDPQGLSSTARLVLAKIRGRTGEPPSRPPRSGGGEPIGAARERRRVAPPVLPGDDG